MCNYIKYQNKIPYCQINNCPCPCFRYCNKVNDYIVNNSPYTNMENCKVKLQHEKGNVLFEKHGYLYIRVDETLNIKLKNPFDYIPNNVKLRKNKNGEYYIVKK